MLTNKKDILEHLQNIANETEELWVCSGTNRIEHDPIIGYGWQCEVCEKIGNLEFTISELEDEVKELNNKNENTQESLDDTKTELEETLEICEKFEAKVEEKNEKLLEIYERYPECGI